METVLVAILLVGTVLLLVIGVPALIYAAVKDPILNPRNTISRQAKR